MRNRLSLLSLLLLLLVWLPRPAHAIKFIWLPGTIGTWLSSGSTLTNNSLLLGSAITLTEAGYTRAVCELALTGFSGAVTANTGMSMWIIRQVDGTNYEDGDGTTPITPARMPDVVFPLRAVSTAQRVSIPNIEVPPGLFKVLLKNDGTGVTMNATWTVKCLPYVLQTAS